MRKKIPLIILSIVTLTFTDCNSNKKFTSTKDEKEPIYLSPCSKEALKVIKVCSENNYILKAKIINDHTILVNSHYINPDTMPKISINEIGKEIIIQAKCKKGSLFFTQNPDGTGGGMKEYPILENIERINKVKEYCK